MEHDAMHSGKCKTTIYHHNVIMYLGDEKWRRSMLSCDATAL